MSREITHLIKHFYIYDGYFPCQKQIHRNVVTVCYFVNLKRRKTDIFFFFFLFFSFSFWGLCEVDITVSAIVCISVFLLLLVVAVFFWILLLL